MKTMNFNPKITLRPGGLVFLGIMPVKKHKNQNFHQIKTRKTPKINQENQKKIVQNSLRGLVGISLPYSVKLKKLAE